MKLALLACCLVLAPPIADAGPKKSRRKPAKAQKQPEPEPEPEPIELAPDPVAAEPTTPAPPASDAEPTAIEIAPVAPKRTKLKRFYVRGGIAHVAPLSMSRELELADVDGAASLAIENGPIEGSGASVGSATVPAITVGYKLNDRWSLETLLGLPFTVKLSATGTLANESLAPMALGIPTGVPPLGSELGEAKAAPPLVTLVYQLRMHGMLRPYAGAGLAVLFAFDEKVTNPILSDVAQPEMSIAPAPGLVLQTGAELKLWKSVYARLDVKFIAFMLARAKVEHIQVRTPELPVFETVEVGTAKMNVWVNPLIVQLGVGVDF
jgi:outer membrane protein W